MDNDTKATEAPEKETQDSPMPSEEQKTPESQSAEQGASDSSPEEGLPDSAKERTKNEFDKLKGQLKEERTRREYTENINNQLQQKQQEDSNVPAYDPETGLVNEKALNETQQRAQSAEQRVIETGKRLDSFIENQENREAFTAHPELDPSSESFNQDLHVATRRILTDAMLNPNDYGGKTLSFKEAGDKAKSSVKKDLDEAREEGAKDAVEQLTPKEQAALDAVGTPGGRSKTGGSQEDLQQRTRQGDPTAIIERMKRMEKQE